VTPARKKRLYVKTYGCQMNVYDSSCMERLMGHAGYAPCAEVEDADMAILNTCHIREKAAEKMYSELGRMNILKTEKRARGEDLTIVVAGCVGQAEGEEIFARAPYVDAVVGPQSYHHLPDLVAEAQRKAGHAINLDFDDAKFDRLPEETCLPEPGVGYLSVQEGCDKFCSFCVVPYTRGAEYSRPLASVMREALRLAEAGAKEIVLLGQNVNAYHGADGEGGTCSLGRLVRYVAALRGVARVRYTTSHPRDMHEELYAAHAEIPALAPFLSLPVQSGADAVLEAMNRKHTRKDYLKIVETLKEKRPEMRLGSDFIVGFPGETDADFEDTLDLVRRVGFIQGYSFKYSPRPGTPGAEREDRVAESVKDKRLQALQALLLKQQRAFGEACVGKELSVLFSREGRRKGQSVGRSEFMQPVHVDGVSPDIIGTIRKVRVTETCPNSLAGELVG
jgi:tRNA-2-methylthio-N6-dimethylallyladenosine synthase